MTLGYDETYAALLGSVAGRVVSRDVVVVDGPDALSYLQGQCSQDVTGMVFGEARRSLLLNPQGKVVALVRVIGMEAAGEVRRFAVEVDEGYGEVVLERLRRFKLRVKVGLELTSWRCAEVRGPGSAAVMPDQVPGAAVVLVRLDDRFGRGWDLLGPEAELPGDVPPGDDAAFEALRIEAGIPAMGSEIDERTIPQEAGIVGETVSFTKGCYTGQELVARIDARGNRVPRLLRGVVVSNAGIDAGSVIPANVPGGGRAGQPPVGTELYVDDRSVGSLSSVAWSSRLAAVVALAFVRREVDPPAPVRLVLPGATASSEDGLAGEVRELPL